MDASVVFKYFPDLSPLKKTQIEKLYPLYHDWNSKINVVSRKDIDELFVRHILHSLSLAKFYDFSGDLKVIDIGTGGGFPGLPLAILYPETQFLLVDSIGKKIKVVQSIAQELKLNNVIAIHERAEKIKGKFDLIITRATMQTGPFIHLFKHLLAEKGIILALKGGDLSVELKGIKNHKITPIKNYFSEDFFETKVILSIKKLV